MEGESFEFEFNAEGEWGEVFNENELNELASELLEVHERPGAGAVPRQHHQEGGRRGGQVREVSRGKTLGGVLKTAGQAGAAGGGRALGNLVLPGVGGAVGGKLASMAGSALGLELEGLSQEDREFEVAKQVVRLSADATSTALTSPDGAPPDRWPAQTAVDQAMQKYAPGLLCADGARGGHRSPQRTLGAQGQPDRPLRDLTTMSAGSFASWMLSQEARALLTRLERIKSFAMSETMVPAATLSVEAQAAVEGYLQQGRRELREQIHRTSPGWRDRRASGRSPAQRSGASPSCACASTWCSSHFDIFSEAMSQRSEADNGVWLAGLDVVAKDALELPGYYEVPPVICYLARGPGAAIRRARTRLPGRRGEPGGASSVSPASG